MPERAWCDDPDLLQSFVQDLKRCDRLVYLHFIGGETMITPGFATILQRLVTQGLAPKVTVGFTTNLTVWSASTVTLLEQFHSVNLGMSIECVSELNDYVRYGSSIHTVMQTLQRWITVANSRGWLVQLRPTPNVLTMGQLSSVYDLAWQHNLAVESCNFISDPDFMQPSVLPQSQRDSVISDLENWIASKGTVSPDTVINTRDPNQAQQQILQDAASYVHYLRNQPDHSDRLVHLVKYLRTLESRRGSVKS